MKKILVIEDQIDVRENIDAILELEGYQVVMAEDGEIGVEMATLHQPDLILCDVMMPKLDGFGVVQALRQNPITSTIPLIFLTAKADRLSLRQGMDLGADDYLTKPFTLDELINAVIGKSVGFILETKTIHLSANKCFVAKTIACAVCNNLLCPINTKLFEVYDFRIFVSDGGKIESRIAYRLMTKHQIKRR